MDFSQQKVSHAISAVLADQFCRVNGIAQALLIFLPSFVIKPWMKICFELGKSPDINIACQIAVCCRRLSFPAT